MRLNLVDPNGTLIDCVVDINPRKQGHHLPGTGHPIVAPAELPLRGIQRAVLMNQAARKTCNCWRRQAFPLN